MADLNALARSDWLDLLASSAPARPGRFDLAAPGSILAVSKILVNFGLLNLVVLNVFSGPGWLELAAPDTLARPGWLDLVDLVVPGRSGKLDLAAQGTSGSRFCCAWAAFSLLSLRRGSVSSRSPWLLRFGCSVRSWAPWLPRLGVLGAFLGDLGTLLGRSWTLLGRSGLLLGRS